MVHPAAQRSAPTASPLTTGPLAGASGVAVSTLRFYERQGLLEPDGRSGGGYRQYSPDSVRRVRFIRRAQELGFTLREVREVLALSDEPERIVLTDVAEQVAEKLAELDPTALMFTSMFGTAVTMWAIARILRPEARFIAIDTAGRAVFSLWMIWALLNGQSATIVVFLIGEVTWFILQLSGLLRLRRR